MRDLAILVPSRGRPENVERLKQACAATCATDYQLCWAFDNDDPTLDESKRAAGTGVNGGRSYLWTGPRDGLAGWTNRMWAETQGDFRYYASIGDDHVPITHGWDKEMTAALEDHGGGFAYCWNGVKQEIQNFPEMCVISAPILDALGWMCEPTLKHYCVDVVWMDLGGAADCLYYLPGVTLQHRHWMFGTGARDGTYWDAMERGHEDVKAHEVWRAERMAADVATVREAIGA
jgi:hypothetical protein